MPETTPRTETGRKVWWRQRTFWASLSALALAIPPLIDPMISIIPDRWRASFNAAAIIAAAAATLFARIAGVVAAEEAATQGLNAAANALDVAEQIGRRRA